MSFMWVVHLFIVLLFLFFVRNESQTTPSPTQTDPTCSETYYTANNNNASTYDRRDNKARLRIVTYNVEFLFDLNHSCTGHTLDCPGADCRWVNTSMSDQHMSTIASNIESINADIYILPEIEDCCVIDYWYETYFTDNMKSLYNYYVIRGTDYYTGQNILLLTKIDPINNIQRITESGTYPRNDSTCSGTWGNDYQSVSKNLIANFSNILNFPTFTLIGIHLLAQPTNSDRCGPREAQATVIANKIKTYYTNDISNEFIIGGDFNDYDSVYPDRHGHTPITNVLKYLKHIEIESSDMWLNLTNTAQYVNQTWRYTHWPQSSWDSEDGCLDFASSYTDQYDYILLTKGLNDMIDNVTIGWELCGTYESDHLPLIVDLVNQTAIDNMNNDDSNSNNENTSNITSTDGSSGSGGGENDDDDAAMQLYQSSIIDVLIAAIATYLTFN